MLVLRARAANLLDNPGFEDGFEGWSYNEGCEIVTDVVHSGTKAVHCKDTDGKKTVGISQRPQGLIPGVKYFISAWIRLKNVKGGSLLLCAESSNYKYGVYPTSKNLEPCESGTCTNWTSLSATSEMFFGNASWYVVLARLNGGGATGEFWIDDVVFEPARSNLTLAIETTAWKQEVYDEPIDVFVSLRINNSVWHNGNNFTLEVDVEDEAGIVVDTLTNFTLGYRAGYRVATFPYDPSALEPGYYVLRVVLVNHIFDDYVENFATTHLRKLEQKRDLSFYIDQRTMVAYDRGKKFFPLGLYLSSVSDADIDLLTDSPFNLMLAPVLNRKRIDEIHERSHGRLRVIAAMNNKTNATQCVLDLRNSTGLMGYYIYDEPGLSSLPLMIERTRTIRDLDPNRIAYAAVNQRLLLHQLKEGLDVVGIDCYPLQRYDDLHAIYVMARQSQERTCNARARWDIPQIFDWTVYGRLNESPPTEHQLRQMVYQWIAGGAMGFIFYHFSEMQVMDYKNPFHAEWDKVKRVASELAVEYAPIILSGYEGSPRFYLPPLNSVSGANYVGWRTFYYQQHTYILIVNVKAVAQTYSFVKPHDISFYKIHKLMGESKMTCRGDTITLDMPGADVVWLRVNDPQYYPDGNEPMADWLVALIATLCCVVVCGAAAAVAFVLQAKGH